MMRRTTICYPASNQHGGPFGWRHCALKCSSLNHNNVCEQPYYLKPVPENPYLGTVHDGVTREYGKGFSVKPIHHLYRFTHNILPLNVPRGVSNRPSNYKNVHWLDSTVPYKVSMEFLTFEAIPLLLLSVLVVGITVIHLVRVTLYHPDITWYNLAFPTNKSFTPFVRFNQRQMMDQPVYRYFQNQSEFYFKDAHFRAKAELEFAVNDPFINHVKAIGRGEELQASSSGRFGPRRATSREGGFGHLIPTVFQEKSEWWTPKEEQYKENPDRAFRENDGSPFLWTLYTNLARSP